MTAETLFTYGAPDLKFGPGAADEIGFDVSRYGASRVLVITDPGVAAAGGPQRVVDAIRGYRVQAHLFTEVHVEPTDVSLRKVDLSIELQILSFYEQRKSALDTVRRGKRLTASASKSTRP